MRGLKPLHIYTGKNLPLSHPLRMRGLKLGDIILLEQAYVVASFADAWIETSNGQGSGSIAIVASFADAWIETLGMSMDAAIVASHPLRMRGLKPENNRYYSNYCRSHPLRMRGLKLIQHAIATT